MVPVAFYLHIHSLPFLLSCCCWLMVDPYSWETSSYIVYVCSRRDLVENQAEAARRLTRLTPFSHRMRATTASETTSSTSVTCHGSWSGRDTFAFNGRRRFCKRVLKSHRPSTSSTVHFAGTNVKMHWWLFFVFLLFFFLSIDGVAFDANIFYRHMCQFDSRS